jgi:hypothetical protein
MSLHLPAHAYRPFDSTDADVVDPSIIEVELGPLSYLHGEVRSRIMPEVTLNVGLARGWEAVFEGARVIALDGSDSETTEFEVLAKAVVQPGVLQDMQGASLAVEFGALLPRDEAQDAYGATAAVIRSAAHGGVLSHFNLQATYSREHEQEIVLGLILEPREARTLRPVAELLVEHVFDSSDTEASLLLGSIWERGDVALDVAVRVLRDAGWTYEGRLGITWAFSISGSSH